MRRAPQHSGFTLVEIMIVVAIIAVLAAIALPTFQKQTGLSKRVEAVAILHATFNAQLSHLTTYDSYAATYLAIGLDQLVTQLKYYRLPISYPGQFLGCWAVSLEICVLSPSNLPPWNGFIAALSGNIDGDDEGSVWTNEDSIILGFGDLQAIFPPNLTPGVPQIYADDFLN